MSGELWLRNRQHACAVDLRLLRHILRALLQDRLGAAPFELGVALVDRAEMTRLNETFLRHAGPTDVIAFDYAEPRQRLKLHGEICVCPVEAAAQARRFRTSWPKELVRCIVHGILHLLGYRDARAQARRVMKREEDRLVAQLAARFPLSGLKRASKSLAVPGSRKSRSAHRRAE